MAEVAKNIEIFCFNSFGCRVVLKLFDIMAVTDEELIQNYAESYVERNVRKMMLDQNANYIIQKIIMLQPSSKIDYITDIFVRDVGPPHADLQAVRQPVRVPRAAAPGAEGQTG